MSMVCHECGKSIPNYTKGKKMALLFPRSELIKKQSVGRDFNTTQCQLSVHCNTSHWSTIRVPSLIYRHFSLLAAVYGFSSRQCKITAGILKYGLPKSTFMQNRYALHKGDLDRYVPLSMSLKRH